MLIQRVFTFTNTSPLVLPPPLSLSHRGDLFLCWRLLTAFDDIDAQFTCDVRATLAGVTVWREQFHAWPRSRQQPCNLTPSELYYADWEPQRDETLGHLAWAAHPEAQAERTCRMWTYAPPGATGQRWTMRTYAIPLPGHDAVELAFSGAGPLMQIATTGVLYLAVFVDT